MSAKSDFIDQYLAGTILDQNDLKRRLSQMAGQLYDQKLEALKMKGSATVATVEALTDMVNNDVYKMTDGGTLNTGDTGEITVAADDLVYYDASAGAWKFLHDIA